MMAAALSASAKGLGSLKLIDSRSTFAISTPVSTSACRFYRDWGNFPPELKFVLLRSPTTIYIE
ncbi:hypothetical protein LC653_44205 [Nostoc sp. CHAB 5784]|uniref:hypothetical protein n=1 Tax=Nostoc mirabile TaxID=2907820 RepID=UPI001E65C786|nr:hypothetical protein [Nostoc mirabile]MCC5670594.1 hypothetical protein [Nostoc mirabile CHAB5784]